MSNADVDIHTQIPLKIFYFSWTCSLTARLFSRVTVYLHFHHTQRNEVSKLPMSLSTLVIICLVCHGHFGSLFWSVFHGLQDQFSFPPTMTLSMFLVSTVFERLSGTFGEGSWRCSGALLWGARASIFPLSFLAPYKDATLCHYQDHHYL